MGEQISGPKISVLTAARNVGSSISRLYESLVAQKYGNFEWVVVDGLSSDSTVSQLQEFARRSPWVRFISEADFGIYHAINKALAIATGEYYVVAGGDDVFNDNALEKYAEHATAHNPDVVLARVHRGRKVIGGFRPGNAWISPTKVFPGSHSIGMLFRKDLHSRFGLYSARFPLLADSYFMKILLQSGSVRFVEADFIAGTFTEGGASCVNCLQILAETWQIQMLTERSPLLQTLVFVGKIIARYPALRKELRGA